MEIGDQAETSPAGLWLVLEASSAAGSVALLRVGSRATDGACLARHGITMGASRTDSLFPAVRAMLEQHDKLRELRGVVCGSGPGSFTSLRIAASVGKGLAHALACPLFAVSSLLLAAASRGTAGAYRVHSDAMRDERYVLDVDIDADGLAFAIGTVARMTRERLLETIGERVPLAIGESANETSPNALYPDAAALLRVRDWWTAGAQSLDAWEPDYGRLAEAQVKWEVAHDRALPLGEL